MRRSSVALLVALSSSLFTAACSDTSVVASRATAPSERASVNNAAAPGGCSFTTVSKTANGYFASRTDPVFTMISAVQTAAKTDIASATAASWPILRRVADVRLTSTVGSAAAGKTFLTALLACTNLNGDATDFLAHADSVLASGMLAVRTGGDTKPAAAMLNDKSTGVRSFAEPTWGVEPIGGSWPVASVTGTTSYLAYGYPIKVPLTDVTAATAINTNGTGSYNGFELGTLPASQDKETLRVGICKAAGDLTSRNRLIHDGSIQGVNENPASLCLLSGPTADAGPYLSMRGIGGYLASLFSPGSLYAQDGVGFIGGHVSDWSPFTSATLTSSNVVLTFSKISGAHVDQFVPPFTVTVKVGTRVIPGVDVTLTLANNSGLPAGAEFTAGSKLTVRTLADGIAKFDSVAFHKAGGYTITATGNIGGLLTNAIISNPVFNIKN